MYYNDPHVNFFLSISIPTCILHAVCPNANSSVITVLVSPGTSAPTTDSSAVSIVVMPMMVITGIVMVLASLF